ncbi:DUF5689 domain-containing protein [Flavobacterium hauense]
MKAVFNKSVLALIMTAGLLASCVNEDDYKTPNLNCAETYLTANLKPQEVPAVDIAKPYSGPVGGIIEAYVVSSDVSGNFFKTISLQTKDGSFGFSIPVDVESIFRKMEPGRLVFVKLDSINTYTDIEFGSLRIGGLYNEIEVGRLSPADFQKIVIPSCKIEKEDNLVRKMTIDQALNDANINTLIELQDVEFDKAAARKGNTYYDKNNAATGATNYNLEDKEGNVIIFRTSEFTAYASHTVPSKSGTVRGVLTKYRDTYQFISRTEDDIKLTKDRFGSDPNENEFALGGTSISFAGSLTENFEGYAVSTTNFANYVNDHTSGDKYWLVKQFPTNTGNKYIEMTAFNGTGNPGSNAKSYFFVPVDFSAANTFSFKKEIRNMKGEALKVYYVTAENYKARYEINTANFVDITDSFADLIYPDNGASQNTFTPAGTYTIPATLTGNGYFVFEYTGSTTVTTTIQIDDIVIN